MDHAFLGKTVKEVVTFNIVTFPLPYHHFANDVTKLVPYFIDSCIFFPGNCKFFEYVDFCFKN